MLICQMDPFKQYDQYKQRLERAGAVGLDKESMVQDLTWMCCKRS